MAAKIKDRSRDISVMERIVGDAEEEYRGIKSMEGMHFSRGV